MGFTRRHFLGVSTAAVGAVLADELFGPAWAFAQGTQSSSVEPTRQLTNLADVALGTAKKLGASYADIRINRYRDEIVSLRTVPDLATGKVNHVPSVSENQSFGFGVRVLVNGTWGFSSSPIVTAEEVARIAGEAIAVSKASAALQTNPVQLAPVRAYVDRWTTPHKKNPFEVPIPDKLALLEKAHNEAKKVPKVFSASSVLIAHAEDKFFASSEGSRIQQYVLHTYGVMDARARDLETRIARTRTYRPDAQAGGWELMEAADFPGNARRIGEQVVEHLSAPAVKPGKKDLVLLPGNLGLTIHESIGHATELDRALGYEANLAGTSFVTVDKRGKLRYGPNFMNIQGDRTLPGGLSTCGYDDDGAKTIEWLIIENGVFQRYQTIRDQAHLIGEKEGRACSYADSWDSIPFQRIPNVWLKPNEKEMSLDTLIGQVDDGILIDDRGSWSIDQQRYNFQFGGDAFWEIKNGKKGNMISRVAYQSRTQDFWSSYAGSCDKRFWRNVGLTADGKGEPGQTNSMSHGCAPSLFRQVNVLLTD
jgi:TldD protein